MKDKKVILSSNDFKNQIIANIRSMDLQNVFMIEDFYIDRLITSWCEHQAQEDYKSYLNMMMTIPDNLEFIDLEGLLFKLSRRLVDELVLTLTESFYYEDIGMNISEDTFHPYEEDRQTAYVKRDKESIKYFLSVIDVMFDRIYVGTSTTKELLQQALQDNTYLR